jgi:DNA-binding transcriptional MerR regulator
VVDQHLSIGEVLTLLQAEFPDVTISKIRFLESQGLIDPERTPSGYRKFYGPDIERLRWILTQQRENFLPLKVIKDRLGETTVEDQLVDGAQTTPDGPLSFSPTSTADGPDAGSTEPAASPVTPTVRASMPAGEVPGPASQPIWMADLARGREGSSPDLNNQTQRETSPRSKVTLDDGPTDVSLTSDELQAAAGISADSLKALVQFGLVSVRHLGNDSYFDADALIIARKAAAFLDHGIEARHLRMFKVAAEREAGFLEQLAMPLLKQRNPEARRQAVRLVEELADHGHDLRAALLRANLRKHLDSA